MNVTVVATDKGSPRRNSSATISVRVVDMNLHAPVFVQPDETLYNASSNLLPHIDVLEVSLRMVTP